MMLNRGQVHILAVLTGWALALAVTGCKTTDDASATRAALQPAVTVPPAPEPPVGGVTVNGFTLADFEYWPFRFKPADGTCAYPYPGSVVYGFDAGSAPAQACMRQAYQSLWAILHDPPPALVRLRERGGPTTFYLWVNDYTEARIDARGEPVAECRPDVTMRGIWHFNPPRGLIKWVNEVYRDGSCRIRSASDLAAFAEATLAARERGVSVPTP